MRAAALALLVTTPAWAQAPSFETRQQVLRSLVQVTASDCADGASRSGSGFALETPGRIVTAHHVVGGCRTVQVSYEAVQPPAPRRREARILRVLSAGDLSLLQIDAPPAVPVLRMAAGAPARDQLFAGFGYALGMPTAGDQEVRFSTGASRLSDILPPAAADELRRSGSPIAVEREVLRFNVALQPGMSGGPIVNAAGEVIGVVAGGLKAGAAPASWGWPGDGVRQLLASTEATDRVVRTTSTYYSMTELSALSTARQQGQRLRCGALEFTDTGLHPLGELMRGADDLQRVIYLISISGDTIATLAGERFRAWVHGPSGATALVPADMALKQEGATCVARAQDGSFQQVVWAAPAANGFEHGARTREFEEAIQAPLLPRYFSSQLDTSLTTFFTDSRTGQTVPGPLVRDNGLAFARKGVTLYKRPAQFYGDRVPEAHVFETMVASAGLFLGVATINQQVDTRWQGCMAGNPQGNPGAMGCVGAIANRRAWTRFVLATQLSTFPTY
jgi:S1-C subfamily serine protease